MIIYGIKNCDSVRKAIKHMKNNDIAYEFVDFKQTAVDIDKINSWLSKTTIDTLFNKRGTTYRILKLKDLNLTDEEKAIWLAKNNMLIKRPIIEHNNSLVVGYDIAKYEKIF